MLRSSMTRLFHRRRKEECCFSEIVGIRGNDMSVLRTEKTLVPARWPHYSPGLRLQFHSLTEDRQTAKISRSSAQWSILARRIGTKLSKPLMHLAYTAPTIRRHNWAMFSKWCSSDQPEHVVSDTPFHGIRFAIFVFNTCRSAFSGHLL